MTKVSQVIISDETTEGNGLSMDSRVRKITKVLTLDGVEIARYDPCGGYTLEDLIRVAKFFSQKDPIQYTDGHWHKLILVVPDLTFNPDIA